MMNRPAEAFWKKPHGAEWLSTYVASTFGPKRKLLGDALRAVAPFDTALDLGCNCGVLVPWLTVASPNVKIHGVDVSVEALAEAIRSWPHHTWTLASIVDWLPKVDGPWDVVVSSSCLEHVAPADLDAVLLHVARVAAKAIVLQEVAVTNTLGEGPSLSGVPEWRHDYAKRLTRLGWTLLSERAQDEATNRPGKVMTFARDRT